MTDEDTLATLTGYRERMGHSPVRATDTPGFLVNHAGRGFGTEALRIVSEGIASFADVDRVMTDVAGFRLGPFELFDLTGLDVSHRGDRVDLSPVLRRAALPSGHYYGTTHRCRPLRAKVGERLLRLRRRKGGETGRGALRPDADRSRPYGFPAASRTRRTCCACVCRRRARKSRLARGRQSTRSSFSRRSARTRQRRHFTRNSTRHARSRWIACSVSTGAARSCARR